MPAYIIAFVDIRDRAFTRNTYLPLPQPWSRMVAALSRHRTKPRPSKAAYRQGTRYSLNSLISTAPEGGITPMHMRRSSLSDCPRPRRQP
jgi:hypothetical protein